MLQMAANITKFKISPRELVKTISEKVDNEIYEKCLDREAVTVDAELPSGYIEVFMTNAGTCEVSVVHSFNEHVSSTLEMVLAEHLPNWEDVYARAMEESRKESDFRHHLLRNSRRW